MILGLFLWPAAPLLRRLCHADTIARNALIKLRYEADFLLWLAKSLGRLDDFRIRTSAKNYLLFLLGELWSTLGFASVDKQFEPIELLLRVIDVLLLTFSCTLHLLF